MKKYVFRSVDEYLASQPAQARHVLKSVRRIVRSALPQADEVISYKMPAYKIKGTVVLYFAGWKHHYSVYPAGARLVEAFKDELMRYKLSKGTIRFPLSEPIPEKLVARIAKFRAKESTGRENTRPRKNLIARKTKDLNL